MRYHEFTTLPSTRRAQCVVLLALVCTMFAIVCSEGPSEFVRQEAVKRQAWSAAKLQAMSKAIDKQYIGSVSAKIDKHVILPPPQDNSKIAATIHEGIQEATQEAFHEAGMGQLTTVSEQATTKKTLNKGEDGDEVEPLSETLRKKVRGMKVPKTSKNPFPTQTVQALAKEETKIKEAKQEAQKKMKPQKKLKSTEAKMVEAKRQEAQEEAKEGVKRKKDKDEEANEAKEEAQADITKEQNIPTAFTKKVASMMEAKRRMETKRMEAQRKEAKVDTRMAEKGGLTKAQEEEFRYLEDRPRRSLTLMELRTVANPDEIAPEHYFENPPPKVLEGLEEMTPSMHMGQMAA